MSINITNIVKKFKKFYSTKEIMIVLLVIVISVSLGFVVFEITKKDVVIDNDGELISIQTMKSTVGEVLKQAKIEVSNDDYISFDLDSKLNNKEKNTIHIKRAVPVNLYIDGENKIIMTYKDTVKEALESKEINLSDSDKILGYSPDDKIIENMSLKVVRVKEEIIAEEETIPFEVVKEANNSLDEGVVKTVQEGQDGVKKKQFKVIYEDGRQILKEMVNETILSNPINKIVQYGTILNHKTARGDTLRYKKVLDMKATAYTASYKDTGKSPGDPGFGITYTGVKAKKGIIAVDPKVIPLGTKVYIEVAGNIPDYGYAVAADIGGAVKGNKIDLYMDGQDTVDNWGVKKVKVYIIDEP